MRENTKYRVPTHLGTYLQEVIRGYANDDRLRIVLESDDSHCPLFLGELVIGSVPESRSTGLPCFEEVFVIGSVPESRTTGLPCFEEVFGIRSVPESRIEMN